MSGGILPVHWIGARGRRRALPARAGHVDRRRRRRQRARPATRPTSALNNDSNRFKAVRVKIEVLGLGLPDLRVGIGGLYDRDRAGVDGRAPRPARPADRRVHRERATPRTAGSQLTLIAEAYGIFHRADVETFITSDAFVVRGYRLGRLTPVRPGRADRPPTAASIRSTPRCRACRRRRRRSTRPRSWSARGSTPACGARSSSSTAPCGSTRRDDRTTAHAELVVRDLTGARAWTKMSGMDTRNHFVRLAARPVGLPRDSDWSQRRRGGPRRRPTARCWSRCSTCRSIRRCAGG